MKFLSMKKTSILHIFLLFSLLLSLTGCSSSSTKNSTEQTEFDSFLSSCFKEYVSEDTITMHFKLSNPSVYGLSENDSPSFGDLSLEAQEENCQHSAKLLAELNRFSISGLSEEQKLTRSILQKSLEYSAVSKEYILYQSLLGTNGLQSQIPVTLSEYPFRSEADIKTYLALLTQIPDLFDQILSFEETRREENMISPDFVISNTIDQIDQFLNASEENNLLVESFEEKIQSLSDLGNDQKNTYINNNRSLIRQIVLPAYESLKSSLQNYLGTETKTERLCQYKKGKEYYELLLAANVGTSLSPKECISVLEEQLQTAISDITELTENNPELYTDYLSAIPALSDTDEILSELSTDTLIDFPKPPEVSYTLKTVPEALSTTSACAFYLVPPIDSTDDNVIYINNNRVDNKELFSTLAHEGYPGHLYQTNYYLSTNPHPLRSLLRTDGYDEGWGTYAQLYSYHYLEFENMEKDITESLQKLYQNNDILSLSLSSLSDLYVNYENYDETALAEYLSDYGIPEENVTNIYEYVIENPTTYLSYSIGYYELTNLQDKMKEKYTEQFDIKAFHKAVLDSGSCPFSILEEQVEQRLREYYGVSE